MKVSFSKILFLLSYVVSIEAAYLSPHAIMCLNSEAVKHFVALDKKGDYNGISTYLEEKMNSNECVEVHRNVHIITSKKLSGGVSKVFIKDPNGKTKYAYALTQEIRN